MIGRAYIPLVRKIYISSNILLLYMVFSIGNKMLEIFVLSIFIVAIILLEGCGELGGSEICGTALNSRGVTVNCVDYSLGERGADYCCNENDCVAQICSPNTDEDVFSTICRCKDCSNDAECGPCRQCESYGYCSDVTNMDIGCCGGKPCTGRCCGSGSAMFCEGSVGYEVCCYDSDCDNSNPCDRDECYMGSCKHYPLTDGSSMVQCGGICCPQTMAACCGPISPAPKCFNPQVQDCCKKTDGSVTLCSREANERCCGNQCCRNEYCAEAGVSDEPQIPPTSKCCEPPSIPCEYGAGDYWADCCSGTKPYCDDDMGCVECRDSADCPANKHFCSWPHHTCNECDASNPDPSQRDAPCVTPGLRHCGTVPGSDPPIMRCVQCTIDSDCDGYQVCNPSTLTCEYE